MVKTRGEWVVCGVAGVRRNRPALRPAKMPGSASASRIGRSRPLASRSAGGELAEPKRRRGRRRLAPSSVRIGFACFAFLTYTPWAREHGVL